MIMHTCRDCRYFAFGAGEPVGGSLELGRCLLGEFLVSSQERACEARPLRRGEVVRRRSGGFALVAEDQPRWVDDVMVRRLHTTGAASRRGLASIDDTTDND